MPFLALWVPSLHTGGNQYSAEYLRGTLLLVSLCKLFPLRYSDLQTLPALVSLDSKLLLLSWGGGDHWVLPGFTPAPNCIAVWKLSEGTKNRQLLGSLHLLSLGSPSFTTWCPVSWKSLFCLGFGPPRPSGRRANPVFITPFWLEGWQPFLSHSFRFGMLTYQYCSSVVCRL